MCVEIECVLQKRARRPATNVRGRGSGPQECCPNPSGAARGGARGCEHGGVRLWASEEVAAFKGVAGPAHTRRAHGVLRPITLDVVMSYTQTRGHGTGQLQAKSAPSLRGPRRRACEVDPSRNPGTPGGEAVRRAWAMNRDHSSHAQILRLLPVEATNKRRLGWYPFVHPAVVSERRAAPRGLAPGRPPLRPSFARCWPPPVCSSPPAPRTQHDSKYTPGTPHPSASRCL